MTVGAVFFFDTRLKILVEVRERFPKVQHKSLLKILLIATESRLKVKDLVVKAFLRDCQQQQNKASCLLLIQKSGDQTAMKSNESRIRAAFLLFIELKCCFVYGGLSGDINDEDAATSFPSLDEDKMRCHIINCMTALHLVQKQKMKKAAVGYDKKYELVKRKVFTGAISMIIGDEFESDQAVVDTILSAFPDKSKMYDERSWLPCTLLSH